MRQNGAMLERLQDILVEREGRDLLVTSNGEVFVGTVKGRRPHDLTLSPEQIQAVAEALRDTADGGTPGSGAFDVLVDGTHWTVVGPPVAANLTLYGVRAPREPTMLGDLVEKGLMSSSTAQQLVKAVRDGETLLIVGPRQHEISAVLDAMFCLASPGQRAFYIGAANQIDTADATATVLDRRSLARLDDEGRAILLDALRDARWVFQERIASASDLSWWLGGECFARGRIGGMVAADAVAAKRKLGALHRQLHNHEEESVDLVIDGLVFVKHLRAGRGESITFHPIDALDDDSVPKVERVDSTTAVAQAIDLEALGEEETSGPEPDFSAPTPEETEASKRASSDSQPSVATMAGPTDEDADADADAEPPSAREKSEETPKAHVRRRSKSSPRIQRPRLRERTETSSLANTSQLPKVEKPDTSAVPPEPERGAGGATPAASDDNIDSSLSRAVSSAFDDYSELFPTTDGAAEDEAAREEPTSKPEQPAAPASQPNSLFGPGELDDVLGGDDAAPPSRERPGGRAEGRAGEKSQGPESGGGYKRTASGTRYNAATARHDAEKIRASQQRFRDRPRSGEQRRVRRTTAANGESVSHSNWPKAKSRPKQPVAGRGAPTRGGGVARPDSAIPLEESDIESLEQSPTASYPASGQQQSSGGKRKFDGYALMQEGTLDDDVEGDFADEPTRRAEWPRDNDNGS